MDNFSFLKKYLELQTSIMFDEVIDLGFARLGFCQSDPDSFWNNALIGEEIGVEQIEQIEAVMSSHNRKPVLYFENNKSALFIDLLKERGYALEYEDSWMFHLGNNLDYDRQALVKKVENDEDLKLYLEVFNNCYQNNDPQNPYGELGDYLKTTEDVWRHHHKTKRLEYFIVYRGVEAVAVATLASFDNIGYISNIGSLPKVRGEGFGKIATLFSVEQSIKNGNTLHCLATEEKTYPNEFYKRLGFETRFTGVGFSKTL